MPSTPQRNGLPVKAFVSRFDAQVHAVSACRRDFVGWLRGADVDGGAVEDLEVVFSELAANAVDASTSPSDDVGVRAELHGDVLVLEVSNHTERTEVCLPAARDEDGLRQRGRGLLIARGFVDTLHTEMRPPDRFVVRCCRRLSGRR